LPSALFATGRLPVVSLLIGDQVYDKGGAENNAAAPELPPRRDKIA